MKRNTSWLHKVRNGDEATKRFWLYLLSSVTMAGVVALWMAYISVSIPRVGEPGAVANRAVNTSAAIASAGDLDVSNLFKDAGLRMSRGIALAKDLIKDYILGEPNTIEIKKNSGNFILDGLPEVPSAELPK